MAQQWAGWAQILAGGGKVEAGGTEPPLAPLTLTTATRSPAGVNLILELDAAQSSVHLELESVAGARRTAPVERRDGELVGALEMRQPVRHRVADGKRLRHALAARTRVPARAPNDRRCDADGPRDALPPSDMELGHWVTGSMGHLGHKVK